jgi:hypothetical protein
MNDTKQAMQKYHSNLKNCLTTNKPKSKAKAKVNPDRKPVYSKPQPKKDDIIVSFFGYLIITPLVIWFMWVMKSKPAYRSDSDTNSAYKTMQQYCLSQAVTDHQASQCR